MIRVTQAEYLRDSHALTARARATKQSIEITDEAGNVRQSIHLGCGPDGIGLARFRSATCGVCVHLCTHGRNGESCAGGPQFCVMCLREHGDHLELGLREMGADDE